MTNWIDLSSDILPPRNRLLIAYCPEWCYSGYSIVILNKSGYFECETHGTQIDEYVEKWALFMKAD